MMPIGRCARSWLESDIDLMRNARMGWHARWAKGVFIPADARRWLSANDWRPTLPRIVRVGPSSGAPIRLVAYRAARLFQRENGYDFAMFPQQRMEARRPTAYLWIEGGRAIGIVTLNDAKNWGWLDDADENRHVALTNPPQWRAIVSGVWVAGNHRRKGIASRLIERRRI